MMAVMAFVIAGDARAQMGATNTVSLLWPGGSNSPARPVAGDGSMTNDTNLIPLIQFSDVPITTAIDNLARQAGINLLIDSDWCRQWQNDGPATAQEPVLTLHWKNITAREALQRIVDEYDLKLVEDPATTVTFVVPIQKQMEMLDPNLLNMGTKAHHTDLQATNEIIPLIKFSDVPMNVAFKNLFRQIGVNCVMDPRVLGESPLMRYPTVNMHWMNITPQQAILALCEGYDLTLSPDDESDGIRIEPAPVKKHHHLRLK